VKKGNYMGQNFGVITGIDEGGIKLKELVQDGSGEWVERASALQLVETSQK
jgi:type IV pilus assembly protein PilP